MNGKLWALALIMLMMLGYGCTSSTTTTVEEWEEEIVRPVTPPDDDDKTPPVKPPKEHDVLALEILSSNKFVELELTANGQRVEDGNVVVVDKTHPAINFGWQLWADPVSKPDQPKRPITDMKVGGEPLNTFAVQYLGHSSQYKPALSALDFGTVADLKDFQDCENNETVDVPIKVTGQADPVLAIINACEAMNIYPYDPVKDKDVPMEEIIKRKWKRTDVVKKSEVDYVAIGIAAIAIGGIAAGDVVTMACPDPGDFKTVIARIPPCAKQDDDDDDDDEDPFLSRAVINPKLFEDFVNATRNFTGLCLDQFGRPFTQGSHEWESSNTAVATVDQHGKVTIVGVGTATITFKCIDGQITVSDDAIVIGKPPVTQNQPPNAHLTASPASGVDSLNVTLDASASTDPDGTIVKYEWDFDGDGDWDDDTTTATTTHLYGIGTWTPKVRVTDDDGLTDVAVSDTTITVTDGPDENPWADVEPFITPRDVGAGGSEPLRISDGDEANFHFVLLNGDGELVTPPADMQATWTVSTGTGTWDWDSNTPHDIWDIVLFSIFIDAGTTANISVRVTGADGQLDATDETTAKVEE